MHENNKKQAKKTGRHFVSRPRDYVDTFRWGFVDGGEQAENSAEQFEDDIQRPKKKQDTPVRKTQARTESVRPKPVRPAAQPPAHKSTLPVAAGIGSTDLSLPSYGRTPIPTDEELTLIAKRKREAGDGKKEEERGKKEEEKKNIENKKTLPVSPPHPPFKTETLLSSRREKKQQMVWDPDRREYVPLVVVHSTPAPAVRVKEESRKRVPKPKPAVKPEPPAAEPVVKKEPVREPKVAVSERPPKPRRERPAPVPRGDVSPPTVPNRPDPADIESETKGFAELGVSATMLEALKIVRYLEPTPIQAGVFKQVKAGTDVMGQAHTGTGKTAAFSIPIIEGVEECPPGNDPVALILVPTRELAVQVKDEAARLAYGRDIRVAACYGGKPLGKQIERLHGGVDIVVGTPGRVLDLMNRRALSLDTLKWVVLDEADRMLDIGFRPDIEKILRRTPKDRQTLLFSATLPPPVVRLAEKYMNAPEILDFSPKGVAVDTIDQFYITVDAERKFDALVHLLEQEQPKQAIIFTRTRRGADRLSRLLSRRVENIAAIHGDLSQDQRDSVMGKFRAGTLRYLVATDVVGRGIDVSGISHIINYDIPAFCDDYVHRVGRTGRMGREGVAYTFVTGQEGSELTRIEMRIDKLLKRAELRDFEAFTKPPEQEPAEEPALPPDTKPVYGKRVRKIRRAL
ncbi:MAG: DEAD/DEAH box helicase [Planctomycetaceae bacterium]|nr:DEAD/DEAH box helicase [Planctomycetaceae bacterium]